jgi:hypothetical protein
MHLIPKPHYQVNNTTSSTVSYSACCTQRPPEICSMHGLGWVVPGYHTAAGSDQTVDRAGMVQNWPAL